MAHYDETTIIGEFEAGKVCSVPYIQNNSLYIDLIWNDKNPEQLYQEDFGNICEYWPKVFDIFYSSPEISQQIPEETIGFMNSELRTLIELPPNKDLSKVSFVIFPKRTNLLKKIGIVYNAPKPCDRLAYNWRLDEFPLADCACLDFDRVKEWKPHRNETESEYVMRLCRGTRGNIGSLVRTDIHDFEILIKKSRMGMKYEFSLARQRYLEMKCDNLSEQKDEIQKKFVKTYDTAMGDLGYDASKKLDSKNKAKFHRPSTQFSDDLYQTLKNNVAKIDSTVAFKRKGRHYTLYPKGGIPLPMLSKLFHPSHVCVTYNENPPYDMYMKDARLTYNQTNHVLQLRFAKGKSVVQEAKQPSIHI